MLRELRAPGIPADGCGLQAARQAWSGLGQGDIDMVISLDLSLPDGPWLGGPGLPSVLALQTLPGSYWTGLQDGFLADEAVRCGAHGCHESKEQLSSGAVGAHLEATAMREGTGQQAGPSPVGVAQARVG